MSFTGQGLSGVLVIDKASGVTSFQVVKQIRQLTGARKVGHTGTLDPMATGVLPLCLGEATKIAGLLLDGDKAYEGSALLGVETDTLDITGQVVARHDVGTAITRGAVEEVLCQMEGVQLQVPPAYSAIRTGGQRAYQRARRGEEVSLAPREVNIRRFALTSWDPPDLHLSVECSKGTYVRSLVADVGQQLGCGATLTSLRRVRSGPFTLEQSITIEQLERRLAQDTLNIITIDEALGHLGAVEVSSKEAEQLRHGQPVDKGEAWTEGELLRLRCTEGIVALGKVRDGKLWPKRVFKDLPRSVDIQPQLNEDGS